MLMLVLLLAINSERWEKAAGAFAAALIALYIALESPLSGMSLNPARSFGSALTAGQWTGMWLYFLAPVASMLLATEAYRWMRRHGWIDRPEGKTASSLCLLCDFKDLAVELAGRPIVRQVAVRRPVHVGLLGRVGQLLPLEVPCFRAELVRHHGFSCGTTG